METRFIQILLAGGNLLDLIRSCLCLGVSHVYPFLQSVSFNMLQQHLPRHQGLVKGTDPVVLRHEERGLRGVAPKV